MSEKTVVQKLLIKPKKNVRLINPPANSSSLIGDLPTDTCLLDENAAPATLLSADVILLFAHHRAELAALLPGLRTALNPASVFWIAYHKGTSKVKTDINRDTINAYAASLSLQGIAMVSIDDDWAALRLKVVQGE